ncbi:MAG: TonB C-terminal domain-containing protein [Acidobacteria bacterium]|nr:TonB C-terminal domain-containing protein [Acidobacteriota bacterium]
MYFDFEDYHPDITPVGRAISWREGVLISIIAHLAMIIVILLYPRWFPFDEAAARARMRALEVRQAAQAPRFVFVQPRLERAVPKPPDRGEASDRDRLARTPERAERPANPLPFARGNTPERVEEPPRQTARGRGPEPDPAAGQPTQNPQASNAQKIPESKSALELPALPQAPQNGTGGRAPNAGGSLGDALRNLQRYTRNESFDNQGGGGGQFGPEIQFDTKGVEFGPWIRRFIAQVKRNWFIPYAAMSMKGHVGITFNVHKDGSITDLAVAGPSAVDAFNNAAYGALAGSNPTQPLPPEYPADKAFFTVTFFYNEVPPR